MTLLDMDIRRILEICISGGVERYALDVENVIPLSETVFKGSGIVAEGGGVAGVDIVGDSLLPRDLNENFCFGTVFSFSADRSSVSCFNC
jgi:hypothetical protein